MLSRTFWRKTTPAHAAGDLNSTARLILIAKNGGAKFLDDPDRDRMFGAEAASRAIEFKRAPGTERQLARSVFTFCERGKCTR
jgi:hypothetical protein